MRNKKILFFFSLIFFCLRAFPATFVVTSNADSGPGTLRDALTQAAANGSAVQDSIHFNLADTSAAGRTITILTDLPIVSSNLVIDGSTQPGSKFGVSDAKVKIIAVYNTANTVTCCFNLSNQHNVEIYGFLMDSANLNTSSSGVVSGIYGVLVQNAVIGAPGKGNIMKYLAGINFNSDYNETDSTITENIKISSNIVGLDEDGESLTSIFAPSLTANRIRNLTIGGSAAAEGNIFEGQVNVTEDVTNFGINTGDLLVSNNFFGTDVTGTKPIPNFTTGSTFSITSYNLKSVQISNNLFVAQSDVGVTGISCFFKITGNKFGTDITGANVLGTFPIALLTGYCNGGGIIGGTNPGDGNIFSGAYSTAQAVNQGGVVINIGSPNVEVRGNIFRCNKNTFPYQLSLAGDTSYFVTIRNRSANSISGTATANSRVDLYYSLSCDQCEPEKQFASVNADANGKWKYSGVLSNYNIIASSTSNGTTSEFTRTIINTDSVKIINACLGGTGSITGAIPNNSTNVEWIDSSGNVVDTTANLVNAKPGKYKLVAMSYGCGDSTAYFEIQNKFQLDTAAIVKTRPSCGNSLGSISGINIINNDIGTPYTIWQDPNGKALGYSLNLSNIPAGNYYLLVKSADSSCSQKFGPFTLQNVSGPNIDQSHALIRSTKCGQSSGSITNLTITGSGTLSYAWLNSQQQTVGTDSVLTNQPAGSYTLKVTDASQCGAVYSSAITIPQTNGITLDTSGIKIAVASCSNNNGSITGITATGATQYQWLNANNTAVATTPDLVNAAPGSYTLTASNSFGCSETTKAYTIGRQAPAIFPLYNDAIYFSCTGKSTGSVSVNVDSLVKAERWVDSAGVTVGSGPMLANVPAGTYHLYLTDKNGCETLYNSYNVPAIPQLTITEGSEEVTGDQCGLLQGSITNIKITGGTQPYAYSWSDANNNTLATSLNLTGIGAGTYILTVSDATTCGAVSATYTVQNQNITIAPPSVNNLQLCAPGDALLMVNNPAAQYSYRLYASDTSPTPLDEQAGGVFKLTVKTNTTYYVSQFSGNCESSRTAVQVTVGLTSSDIASAFTPNGDGINDTWVINGISSYPDAVVQVFTRYGQLVFQSRGYPSPFDGTSNGKKLPSGVYYYIINLEANCSLLAGSLTIIR